MIQTLKIADIRAERDMQPRCKMDDETVKDYAENFDELPPVEVAYDGTDYWLWEGWHRLDGAIEAGKDEIEANVEEGTRDDAAWWALTANAKNGLRRTNEDKHRAVELALRHKWGQEMSTSDIAKHCRVTRQFAAAVRKELEKDGSVPEKESPKGKAAKALADPANEGKSHRQIAKEAGVDHETVNRVAGENVNGLQIRQGEVEPLKDGFGNELPDEVEADFAEMGPRVGGHLKALASIARDVNKMYSDEERATRFMIHHQFKAAVRDLKATLKLLVPYCLCPSCGGDGCDGCRNTGWLNKHVYETSVPKGQRWDQSDK